MKFIFCLLLILPSRLQAGELENFLKDFTSVVKNERKKQVLKLVPFIQKYSVLYNLDSLLIAQIITEESSAKPNRVGKLGELGLMQVMPHNFKEGESSETIDGQLNAGCRILSYAINKCKNLLQALNFYGTGSCKPIVIKIKQRYKRHLTIIKKYRE